MSFFTNLRRFYLSFGFLSIAACCLYSTHVSAWGQTGHRVTGEIAERLLSPDAKKALSTLLPNESLAEASTYADEMRSHPSEFWQRTASPWHYVTVPKGKSYGDVTPPPQGDAVTALMSFTRDLKSDSSSLEEKQLALRFIVHIIGDLHQPLHAGDGSDRGGNDLKVTFFWEESNLHRVWDSGLIDRQKLSYTEWTEWLLAKISNENIADWASTNPEDWIAESTIVRDQIYPKDSKNLSWDYRYQSMPFVKQRLQMAGVRIALYLNQLFDESSDSAN